MYFTDAIKSGLIISLLCSAITTLHARYETAGTVYSSASGTNRDLSGNFVATNGSRNNTAISMGDDVSLFDYHWTNVMFDGRLLTDRYVREIADGLLISWGVLMDEAGTDAVQGEVWFVVADDYQFTYYHLSDAVTTQSGPTVFNGYKIKVRADMHTQLYNFGEGADAPVIGNHTDAFIVSATDLHINSAFNGPPIMLMDIEGGDSSSTESLVHSFDMTQVYGIPMAMSATREFGLRIVDANGEPLTEDVSAHLSRNSESGVDCQAVGESVADVPDFFQSQTHALINFLSTLETGIVTSIITGSASTELEKVGFGVGSATVGALQQGVNDAVGTLGRSVTRYIYSSVAEAACEAALEMRDQLIPPNVEIPTADNLDFVAPAVAVCDDTGVEVHLNGSEMEIDGDSVSVTGNTETETVCTSWHYEIPR